MKIRWIGITGTILVLTALVLGTMGPQLFPSAFGDTMPMMNGGMNGTMMNGGTNGGMNGTMMNGGTNGGMNGTMMNGAMNGGMNDGMMSGGMNGTMMSGEVEGDPSLPFDQRFLDQMIMHHQGGVMSTQMMIATSARPELRDLAQRIITGQQREIDQMQQWRSAWYGRASSPQSAMMGQMGGNGTGMMDGDHMRQMMGSSADMDRMFLLMMIPHHEAAISMAQQALTQTEHPEITTLAQSVITTQQAEIEEMQGYLNAWYGGQGK